MAGLPPPVRMELQTLAVLPLPIHQGWIPKTLNPFPNLQKEIWPRSRKPPELPRNNYAALRMSEAEWKMITNLNRKKGEKIKRTKKRVCEDQDPERGGGEHVLLHRALTPRAEVAKKGRDLVPGPRTRSNPGKRVTLSTICSMCNIFLTYGFFLSASTGF